MSKVTIIEDLEDYNNHLTNKGSHDLIIAYFTASWCGPCKSISPTISEIADKNEHIKILKIDVDECDDVATECDISCMPTFKFYKGIDRECIHTFSGANKDELVSTIASLLKIIHEEKKNELDESKSDEKLGYAMPNYDPELNNELLNK